jgi:two-component system nitrate/nitrite response regulator NarL
MTENNRRPVRVAVHSGHRLVRDLLAAYLATQPPYLMVGATSHFNDISPLVLLSRADALLVETQNLTVADVEALSALHERLPRLDIIVVYADTTAAALHAAVSAGIGQLVPATRGLHGLEHALRQRAQPIERPSDGLALTDRELEIIRLLSEGHSVPKMAMLLDISPHTVDNHKRHLYAKLGVGSQAHAVARAASLGLTTRDRHPRDPEVTAGEDGRDLLVILGGTRGEGLDEAAQALVAEGLAVAHSQVTSSANGDPPGGREALSRDHWIGWHRGPRVTVLVDPTEEHWAESAGLGAPIVVVHTNPPTLPALVDVLLRGTCAVLRRDQVATDLAAVLSLVLRGHVTLCIEYVSELAGSLLSGLSGNETALPDLTTRERQILNSIAEGHTVRQTARTLGIATKTVENTQARLFRKLGVHNRLGAVRVAYQLGLVDPSVRGRAGR